MGDAGTDEGFVVGPTIGGGQVVAFADKRGDGTLGVENALALHFGGMGGEHGRDVGVLQGVSDVGRPVVGTMQSFDGQSQRAFLQIARLFVHRAAAHVVAVFGDVGQVAEVAEGADHRHRLVSREVLQQAVQHAACAGVGLEPVGHRKLAHALDKLIGCRAFLFANHVTQDATE